MRPALEGRTALVTGAGRGIGRAVALALAAQGAQLTLAARTQAELDQVAVEVRRQNVECLVHTADVSSREQVDTLVQAAVDAFGGLHAVVNAAGIYGPIGLLTECNPDEWRRAVDVNLMGTVYCCRAALPHLVAAGSGSIVNFSGGGATAALPRFSAYAATKAAVVRLTETLAEEYLKAGVRVNAIAPGAVDTALQDAVLAAGDRAGEVGVRIRRLRESGAGGTGPEVAAALAAFLVSDRSLGLTGRLISAPHDGWQDWDRDRIERIAGTPWFTLRRLDPHTIDPLVHTRP